VLSASLAAAPLAQCELGQWAAPDGNPGDAYGTFVSVHEGVALVGAPDADEGASDVGSVYVYERFGDSWLFQTELVASDGAAGDNFGRVDVCGDVAVVGAPGDDDMGPSSGSVYVYERDASRWTQVAKLTAPDGSVGDWFGSAVSVNEDTIAVGAPFDDDLGFSSGAVYLFERVGGTWVEGPKLLASDGGSFDTFGSALDYVDDRLVVGAPKDDGGCSADVFCDSGSAYFFQRVGGTWFQTAKLTASDASSGDGFGTSVAIDENDLSGQHLVAVGAPFDDDACDWDNLCNSGAVYVFRVQGTGTLSETAKLVADDAGAYHELGGTVSMEDAHVVAGAANWGNSGSGGTAIGHGAAYVFAGSSGWAQTKRIRPDTTTPGDSFGQVAFHRGNAVIGAMGDDPMGPGSGSSYLFRIPLGTGISGCPLEVSVSKGGGQLLTMSAGPERAGRIYVVMGSYTGTSPGIPGDGVAFALGLNVPLNPDLYMDLSLLRMNLDGFIDTLGFLDGDGQGLAGIVIPTGTNPAVAGIVLHHAFVTLDLSGPSAIVDWASNAEPMVLVP
jgi:hypothetical protein